jgi:hypothetical protein
MAQKLNKYDKLQRKLSRRRAPTKGEIAFWNALFGLLFWPFKVLFRLIGRVLAFLPTLFDLALTLFLGIVGFMVIIARRLWVTVRDLLGKKA